MNITKIGNDQDLPTYLPYSEHCLTPKSKFLGTENAVKTFVNLIKESQHASSTPLTEIFSSMPGLTADQKNTAIETVKALEKNARKKLGCQF